MYRGQTLLNPTLASGSNIVQLTPQGLNSVNLGSLSDTFGMYRFEKLQFRLLPGSNNDFYVSYYNELSDVPGATISGQGYIPYSQLQTSSMSMPSKFNVPKAMLVGDNANKYWRTRASSATPETSDPWQQVQGCVNFIAQAAFSCYVFVKYVVRFVNALTTAMTPSPYQRTSFVSLFPHWEKYPILDLYLPGTPHPYPVDRNLDEDWKRVNSLSSSVKTAQSELVRLKKLL